MPHEQEFGVALAVEKNVSMRIQGHRIGILQINITVCPVTTLVACASAKSAGVVSTWFPEIVALTIVCEVFGLSAGTIPIRIASRTLLIASFTNPAWS